MVWKLATVLLAVGLVSPSFDGVHASEPRFALGQVSLAVAAPRAAQRTLVDALHDELAAHDGGAASGQRRFVMSARLSALDTERGAMVKVRCTVSLILTARDTGAIFAMAEGRATVTDSDAARAETSAVQAAAHAAFGRVWSALR